MYRIDFNEPNGDLVELEYFDSYACMIARLCALESCYPEGYDCYGHAGHAVLPSGDSVDYGRVFCEESPYDVYCPHCGTLVIEGYEEEETA